MPEDVNLWPPLTEPLTPSPKPKGPALQVNVDAILNQALPNDKRQYLLINIVILFSMVPKLQTSTQAEQQAKVPPSALLPIPSTRLHPSVVVRPFQWDDSNLFVTFA